MWLRIMLWAMFIGSIVMGYLGIQSGSTTNAIAGIGIFLLVGFSAYFLLKLLFHFGLITAKVVLTLLLIVVIVMLGIRGCQFMFHKGKEVTHAAMGEALAFEEKVKHQSIWDKVSSFFSFAQGDTLSDSSLQPPSGSIDAITTAPTLPERIQGRVDAVYSGYLFGMSGHYVKLYGIDAPDLKQKCRDKRGADYDCGHESKIHLERLILGKNLDCQIAGGDYRENYIATCTVQGVDVGVGMVTTGWAVADRRASAVYIPYEEEAHRKRLGLWAGKFVAPWDARPARAASQAAQRKQKAGFFDGWF